MLPARHQLKQYNIQIQMQAYYLNKNKCPKANSLLIQYLLCPHPVISKLLSKLLGMHSEVQHKVVTESLDVFCAGKAVRQILDAIVVTNKSLYSRSRSGTIRQICIKVGPFQLFVIRNVKKWNMKTTLQSILAPHELCYHNFYEQGQKLKMSFRL